MCGLFMVFEGHISLSHVHGINDADGAINDAIAFVMFK